MIITHKLTVSGREVIALDSIPHAKRYAEERFRRLHGPADALIKWEKTMEGDMLLTWKDTRVRTADFFTSAYKTEEVTPDARG